MTRASVVQSIGQTNNKLRPEDREIHGWYRFVLSFPPHLVRKYLNRFDANQRSLVLDPFCGTGTTLVECAKLGIPSVGLEANPMAYFASQVKLDWSPDPGGLIQHAEKIADHTLRKLSANGIDDLGDLPLFSQTQEANQELMTLSPKTTKLLLKNSVSPLPLHKTLTLLESIETFKTKPFYPHEKLALAKALVTKISNLHFGPEVGIGPPKKDAPVVNTWLDEIQTVAFDIEHSKKQKVKHEVFNSDARNIHSVLKPHSVDAVITSPPYPNEKDYTRTTRLESVILGFVQSREKLKRLKGNLLRSNTRNVYKADTDDLLVSDHPEIQRIANAIEQRRIDLGKTSGFERLYSRVTKLYFGGIKQHLSTLRKVLRPGANLAYIVGDQASYLRVMIRTGELLADIAESLGYEIIGIDLFRTRLATATKEQLREEVILMRWHG